MGKLHCMRQLYKHREVQRSESAADALKKKHEKRHPLEFLKLSASCSSCKSVTVSSFDSSRAPHTTLVVLVCAPLFGFSKG